VKAWFSIVSLCIKSAAVLLNADILGDDVT